MIRYRPHPAASAPPDCDHLTTAQVELLRRRLFRLLGAEIARDAHTATLPAAVRRDVIEMRQAARDALAKVEQRLYGRCEICRGPISYEQLAVVPYARCCSMCLLDEI